MRQLVARGCRVTLVPSNTREAEILDLNPDGVLLSNGPGNPALYTEAIATAQELFKAQIPLSGICLGYQIVGHALGAHSIKLIAGHPAASPPIQDLTYQ